MLSAQVTSLSSGSRPVGETGRPKAPWQESKGQVDGGTPHGPGLHEPLQTKGNVADIDQSGSAATSQLANDKVRPRRW